jgi:hypothetical protein
MEADVDGLYSMHGRDDKCLQNVYMVVSREDTTQKS